MKKPEILAPVGNMAMLHAAINAKADAVYFGVKVLNMRAKAKNFELSQLKNIVELCHANNVNAYLTVNTIVYETELTILDKVLRSAKNSGIDAIICWDLAVLNKARKLGLEIHLSTQASVSNSETLGIYKKLGVRRVVLARECSLEQIKTIKQNTDLEIECFIHGAMCISISGRCFMSHFLYNCSANRGECIQPCRREYKIIDIEENKELLIGNNYIMSPKDLCTIEIMDKLIGVIDAFKIEGRNKSPEYVKTTVECYKEAVDLYFAGKLDKINKLRLIKKLKTVYNRGFSTGFYMNVPITEWSGIHGSKATINKKYVGYITKVYKKANAFDIKVESGSLELGDNLLIVGTKTGVHEQRITSLQIDKGISINKVKKGNTAGVLIQGDKNVNPKDKVFLYQYNSFTKD